MDTLSNAPMADSPLFRGLDPASQHAIVKAGKLRQLTRGEVLFMHGAPLEQFAVVLDGAMRLFRQTPDGKETTIGLAIRGELVGAAQLLERFDNYQYSAAAAEAAQVLLVPAAWFRQQLKADPALALNVLAALADQSHQAGVEAEQLVTLAAPQRVACFLLRLCALHGFTPDKFTLPYQKGTIASRLGMELETFSRALKKLKTMQVDINGSVVAIGNARALECFACGHCSVAEDCATLATLHGTHCGGI